MKNNQALNMTLLCFDPIHYPKNEGVMRRIHYGGSEETFPVENCAVYNEDGSVSLKYYNPTAKKVELRYRLHNYQHSKSEYRKDPDFYSRDFIVEPMTLEPDGYWHITIDPGAGFHSVYFIADGVRVINTRGPYGYDGFDIRNFVDLPDDEDTQLHDVPHGAITREIYWSKETQRYRACWVYTPASYAFSDRKYPILYLQHGGSQDVVCWFQSGKIDMLMDNLTARKEAEEMIIVCNNGYVLKETENGEAREGRLDQVIIQDCMPFIEKKYRVIADRRQRAAAGLSMGGGHVRRLVFGHPELFANVGIFSSGECFPIKTEDMDFSELFSDAKRFNAAMDVVYITCGEADSRYDQTVADLKPLQDQGFHIQFQGYLGQHEWNVWRYSAKDYVKKLFHDEVKNDEF